MVKGLPAHSFGVGLGALGFLEPVLAAQTVPQAAAVAEEGHRALGQRQDCSAKGAVWGT